MFLAIDRVSKFTYVEFAMTWVRRTGLISCAVSSGPSPNTIHTVLTDNGMASDLLNNRERYPAVAAMFGGHIFDRACTEHGIKHKLTSPYHP